MFVTQFFGERAEEKQDNLARGLKAGTGGRGSAMGSVWNGERE